jgi:hypothetical protein
MSVFNLVVPRFIVHCRLLVIYLEMGTRERTICCFNTISPSSCSVVLAATSLVIYEEIVSVYSSFIHFLRHYGRFRTISLCSLSLALTAKFN